MVVHARGGARLAEHLNPATKLGAKTQAALANESWDYVVLQEMSNGPVKFRERFLQATAALCELIRTSGASPILYATWAYAPSSSKLSKLELSYEQMHEGMRDAFAEASECNHLPTAWVCDAFFTHAERETLYAADGVHPSTAGAKVAARVISETIATNTQHGCRSNDGHKISERHDENGASLPCHKMRNDALRSEHRDENGANSLETPECITPEIRSLDASRHTNTPHAATDTAPYFVYILRCEDGSLYTGITTDVARRLDEHRSRGPKAARYTRTHPVVALEATWKMPNRATASRLEYRIKHLSREEKETLLANPDTIGSMFQ